MSNFEILDDRPPKKVIKAFNKPQTVIHSFSNKFLDYINTKLIKIENIQVKFYDENLSKDDWIYPGDIINIYPDNQVDNGQIKYYQLHEKVKIEEFKEDLLNKGCLPRNEYLENDSSSSLPPYEPDSDDSSSSLPLMEDPLISSKQSLPPYKQSLPPIQDPQIGSHQSLPSNKPILNKVPRNSEIPNDDGSPDKISKSSSRVIVERDLQQLEENSSGNDSQNSQKSGITSSSNNRQSQHTPSFLKKLQESQKYVSNNNENSQQQNSITQKKPLSQHSLEIKDKQPSPSEKSQRSLQNYYVNNFNKQSDEEYQIMDDQSNKNKKGKNNKVKKVLIGSTIIIFLGGCICGLALYFQRN